MDELNTQIDDITQNLSDLQSSHEEVSSTVDDLSQSQLDIQSNVDELSQNVGQLQFPLTQDSIDLINDVINTRIVVGRVSLVLGSATITDSSILPTSNILLTPQFAGWLSTDSPTMYVFSITTGSAIVKSTGGSTDTSILAYMIIP